MDCNNLCYHNHENRCNVPHLQYILYNMYGHISCLFSYVYSYAGVHVLMTRRTECTDTADIDYRGKQLKTTLKTHTLTQGNVKQPHGPEARDSACSQTRLQTVNGLNFIPRALHCLTFTRHTPTAVPTMQGNNQHVRSR